MVQHSAPVPKVVDGQELAEVQPPLVKALGRGSVCQVRRISYHQIN